MSLQSYFILGAYLRDELRHTQTCNLLVSLNENLVKVTKVLSLLSKSMHWFTTKVDCKHFSFLLS